MEAKVEVITPNKAARLLATNHGNRPVGQKRVIGYVKQMIAGKWLLNGEAIKVASSGRLMDGQHRLMAVIEANVNVKMLVVRGVDDDSFHTLDTGRPRRSSDALATLGYANSRPLSGGITLIKNLETVWAAGKGAFSTEPIPNSDIIEYAQQNPDIAEWAVVPSALRKMYHSTLYVGLGYLFSRHDDQKGREFFKLLETGASMDTGHPVLTLRKEMIENRLSGVSLMQDKAAAMTILTFNAFLKGKRAATRRLFAYEKFPKIGE